MPFKYCFFLATFLVAFSVQAQTLYKVKLKDGSILITDVVPPGAEIISKTEPGSRPSSAAPLPAPSSQNAAESDARARARQLALDQASKNVTSAEQALADARQALEQGREPLADEIRGVSGGGARTLPAYQERIRRLEQAVATAEARVKEAYAERNAAR